MTKLFKLVLIFMISICVSIPNSFAQDEILFRKHVINSGWHGLLYGIALDVIFELEGPAAVGIPVISSGVSVMIPLLTGSSKGITVNSLMLTNHGKYMGWIHGASLMSIIGGYDAWETDMYKASVAVSALSSIGLGRLGYSLGKNKPWEEGYAALLRHYGGMMSFAGFCTAAAFLDDPRAFGGAVILFGAGGYLLSDMVYKLNPYTRGDVRSTSVISGLHGLLGYGLAADIGFDNEFSRTEWLLPAAGLLAGTGIGHLWLKNANFTPQQGTYTGYAASGGAILGLGIALMINSEKITPWYTIPYATGMASYAYAVEKFKKKNLAYNIDAGQKKNQWNISFLPQNLFINQQFNGRKRSPELNTFTLQPAIIASLKF